METNDKGDIELSVRVLGGTKQVERIEYDVIEEKLREARERRDANKGYQPITNQIITELPDKEDSPKKTKNIKEENSDEKSE